MKKILVSIWIIFISATVSNAQDIDWPAPSVIIPHVLDRVMLNDGSYQVIDSECAQTLSWAPGPNSLRMNYDTLPCNPIAIYLNSSTILTSEGTFDAATGKCTYNYMLNCPSHLSTP